MEVEKEKKRGLMGGRERERERRGKEEKKRKRKKKRREEGNAIEKSTSCSNNRRI